MKNISEKVKSIITALILVGGISYAFAWSGPTTNPPSGNVDAPINTSSSPQAKNGSILSSTLNIGGTLSSDNLSVFNSSIFSGSIKIPTGAGLNKVLTSDATGFASWQSVASAVAPTVTAGTGIVVTGGPAYTVSADYTKTQKIVTGTCSGSSVVQKINADGSVTCYTPSVSPVYCTANGKNFSPGYTCNNASQCPVNGTNVNATTCNAAGQWQSTTMYISTPYNCGTYCFN